MRNLKLTICLGLLTSFAAYAENKGGVFVEPMLTYESGTSKIDFPSPAGSSESDIHGFGVGARLGYHIHEVIFLGVDGRYSMPSYENDDTDIDTGASAYNFGPVVGVQMPSDLGVRLWASYIMAGQMDVEKDQGIDLKFEDASGYRIGGGIKVAAVSLNLEFQQITYSETELQDAGFFSGSTRDVDSRNKTFVFSVSFPISI